MNEKIGGLNIAWKVQASRSQADATALRVMYRAGIVNSAREAAKAATIVLRPSSNLEVHHNVPAYIMRERLRQANGHAENEVVWTSELPASRGAQRRRPSIFRIRG